MAAMAAPLRSEKVRFLVAGASTTAFSYAIYLLLLQLLQPTPAYGVAYVAGIIWAYAINSVWVFRGAWSWRGLAAYPLVYLVQAVLSIMVFEVFRRHLPLPVELLPLVLIAVMLPVTYLLGRAIVRRTSPASRPME